MNGDSLRRDLLDAAQHGEARQSRRDLCEALKPGFRRTGEILRTAGSVHGSQRLDGSSPFGNGDDRLVALGYLSETAAALVGGAVDLMEARNLYAASALNRQLVEVEYLMWAFAEDQEEAASWLRSTQQDRQQRWQPRHLRQRSQGRFRGEDYGEHCEIGGHPTPKGVRALFSGEASFTIEIIVSETAKHGVSAWRYLLLAAVVFAHRHDWDPMTLVPDELAKAVGAAEARWRGVDHVIDIWQARDTEVRASREPSPGEQGWASKV